MKLYEINEEIRSAVESSTFIDEETGEVNFESNDFESLLAKKNDKVIAIAKIIKEKRFFRDAVKQRKDDLAKREKSLSREIDSLSKYLESNVWAGSRYRDDEISVDTSNCPLSVKITGEVPVDYSVAKTLIVPDKNKIKQAINGGEELDFAELVRNLKVKIT
jgi:hypothetical protein